MSDETANPSDPPSPKELRREAKAAVKAAERRRQDRITEARRALETARKSKLPRKPLPLPRRTPLSSMGRERALESWRAAAPEPSPRDTRSS
jgi:hypothetical protein